MGPGSDSAGELLPSVHKALEGLTRHSSYGGREEAELENPALGVKVSVSMTNLTS